MPTDRGQGPHCIGEWENGLMFECLNVRMLELIVETTKTTGKNNFI